MAAPITPIHKVFCVSNIKSHVPLILDLEKLNYDPWRELFTTHCEAYDAIDHIDDTYDEPNPRPVEPCWKKVDAVVKGWIYSTLSQNLLNMILKKDLLARQVWLNIERLFRDNKESRAIQLDTELRNITMGDLSVTAYCSKVKAIADQLENLDTVSKVPDKNLVIYTINGLSSRYDNVASIIRHRCPFPSFDETRSMLLLEEQRLQLSRVSTTPAHGDHSSSPTLLHTATPEQRGPPRRHDSRRQQGNNRRRQSPHSGNNSRQQQPPQPSLSPLPQQPADSPQPYGWYYFPQLPPPSAWGPRSSSNQWVSQHRSTPSATVQHTPEPTLHPPPLPNPVPHHLPHQLTP